jgi:hypothetical protein
MPLNADEPTSDRLAWPQRETPMHRHSFAAATFLLAASAFGQGDDPADREITCVRPLTCVALESPSELVRRIGVPRKFPAAGIGAATSRDRKWHARIDRDGLWLWDLENQQEIARLAGEIPVDCRVEFTTDDRVLVGSLIVWNAREPKSFACFNAHLWSLSRNNTTLAICTWNAAPNPANDLMVYSGSTIRILDFPSLKPRSVRQEKELIQSMDLSPDGSLLAIGGLKKIIVYDVASGDVKFKIGELLTTVHQVKFSNDGKTIASVSDDKLHVYNVPRFVDLWDAATGKTQGRLAAGENWQFDRIEFLPDGNLQGEFHSGNPIRWNIKTLGRIADSDPKRPQPRTDRMWPWKFSADGRTLYTRTMESAGEPDLVQEWHVATGKEFDQMRRRAPSTLRPPPPPKTLETLKGDRALRYDAKSRLLGIVDTKTSRSRTEKVRPSPVWRVSPDGARIAFLDDIRHTLTVVDLKTMRDLGHVRFEKTQTIDNYDFTEEGAIAILEQGEQGKGIKLYEATTGFPYYRRNQSIEPEPSPDGTLRAESNMLGTIDLIRVKK